MLNVKKKKSSIIIPSLNENMNNYLDYTLVNNILKEYDKIKLYKLERSKYINKYYIKRYLLFLYLL